MTHLLRSERVPLPNEHIFSGSVYLEVVQLRSHLDHLAGELLIDTPPAPTSKEDLSIPMSDNMTQVFGELLTGIEVASKEIETHNISPDTNVDDVDDNPSTWTKPLNRHLRYLASRFIIQTFAGKPQEEPDETKVEEAWSNATLEVAQLISNLPSMARQVSTMEVPAYEVLYREFDRLRLENEGGIVEAYMGRDGIFAYFGRLGQLAARGDNEPLIGAYPADPERIARPEVRYIVYGGSVRSAASSLKTRYLSQFVDPDQDIHCFDTGYTGSVPEDVLRKLGFPRAQISSRIHLLECREKRYFRRQISGLPRNVSAGAIEGYAKDENTALGLVDTPEGVKYSATKSNPTDQFNFLARRHLLYTNFLVSERNKIIRNLQHRSL